MFGALIDLSFPAKSPAGVFSLWAAGQLLKRTLRMAAAPSRADLARYWKLKKQKQSFARKAAAAGQQAAKLATKFESYVRAKGGKKRCVLAHGYRLSLDEVREAVSWKNAYTDLKGKKAADKLIESQPLKLVLNVEGPSK
jgi:hypothetical protein